MKYYYIHCYHLVLILCLQWTQLISCIEIRAGSGGEQVSVNVEYGDSVYEKLYGYCVEASNPDECIAVMNYVSFTIYPPNMYTPSRPNSTIEDFLASRYDVLSYLGGKYSYESYLEIGCAEDITFNKLRETFAVSLCVDPVNGGTHRMTSDDFFASNTRTFDIIFIDGLHEAHQVLKDINNALRFLKPNGTIVMHDCNPLSEISSRYPQPHGGTIIWNGDTWRAAAMTRLQDGLEIIIVDIDQGVGLIRRRRNNNRMEMSLENILLEDGINALTWNLLKFKRENLLRLVTLDQMRQWLNDE